MAAMQVSCPACRHQFEKIDGQTARCPQCGQVVTTAVQTVAVEAVATGPPPVPRWYVMRDNRRTGPFDWAEIQRMVVAGHLQPRSLVWKEGTPGWVEAGDVTELFLPRPRPEHSDVMVAEVIEARRPRLDEPPPRPDSYRPGPPPWSHEPEPGGEFFRTIWVHIRRAFAWNLGAMPVTDSERATLQARGIDNEAAQKYLVWRRSIFFMVAGATSVSALLHVIVALAHGEFKDLSALGVFSELVRIFSQLAMPVAGVFAYLFWARVRLSRLFMILGWTVSFALPILIALLPAHLLVDFPPAGSEEERTARIVLMGLLGGLYYFATLTPTVLSILPGVLRACVRLKSLLPQSIVTGWFLIACVPFYALLLFVTFITVHQIAGNALLVLGILLFVGAPLVYLFFGRYFVRPLAREGEVRALGYAQLVYLVVVSAATVLLILYLFTAKLFPHTALERHIVGFSSETSLFLPWRLIQFYIEFVGRSLFTSTLVADLMLLMSHSVWHNLRRFAQTETAAQYDEMMEQVGTALRQN